MTRKTLLATTISALAITAPAQAANPAPKDCGLTPNKHFRIHVDQELPCAFGKQTYDALALYDRTHRGESGFISGESKNFELDVTGVIMDCRALARAHGEFDFYCNDLNRRGNRVVRMDNETLP